MADHTIEQYAAIKNEQTGDAWERQMNLKGIMLST